MAITKIGTIKKAVKSVFCIMAATVFLSGCKSQSDVSAEKAAQQIQAKETGDMKSQTEPDASFDSQEKFISADRAKEIALGDAGTDSNSVSNMTVKIESDDGVWEYEVEFYVGNTEYDYDIDAVSGAILSKAVSDHTVPQTIPEQSQTNFIQPQATPEQPQTSFVQSQTTSAPPVQSQTNPVSQGELITEERAKEIVLQDAGVLENQVVSLRVKLEMDDGIWEYEVEFYAGNKEYDYEIDAASGAIRSKDMDIEDDFYQPPAQNNYISEADARALALARVAGATENNIRMHLDYDDGRAVYEGSIHYQGLEYEFEIDAVTGTFLDWEIDD